MTKISTSWNSQQGDGKYSIQFETNNRALYKMVEAICKRAIDVTGVLNEENRLYERIVGTDR